MSKKVGTFIVDPESDDYIGSGSETDMGVSSSSCMFLALCMLVPVAIVVVALLLRGA